MSGNHQLFSKKNFKRVLIPNRGEIALRIIRTLKDMGIESVLLYAPDDKYGLALKHADYTWPLTGSTSTETYLNIPQICEAIRQSNADAVHPGYGFLSESPEFCRAVNETGAVFIGPDPESMSRMGDKIQARKLMKERGVPVVPGSEGAITSLEELKGLASEIGYPVILKAAAGGGGRGMRIVESDDQLKSSFEACQHEAKTWFGNGDVFCERYIKNPRHIEFQVLLDQYGQGVHLFERDCSIQRRHQKLFEEAPSAYLSPSQREKLGAIALQAAQAANYTGAGTIEFICESPDQAWFMEMNTRIQVEHTVTELITGKDLIREQILVAQGHPLGFEQKDLKIQGWSMEARINCEDPLLDFMPSPGKLGEVSLPAGPHVRTDTAVYSGYEIPAGYDSMIAKLIVSGETREQVISRMQRALGECSFESVKTTIPFHKTLLSHPSFLENDFTTHFCSLQEPYFKEEMPKVTGIPETESVAIAAMMSYGLKQTRTMAPQLTQGEWQKTARQEQTHQ